MFGFTIVHRFVDLNNYKVQLVYAIEIQLMIASTCTIRYGDLFRLCPSRCMTTCCMYRISSSGEEK